MFWNALPTLDVCSASVTCGVHGSEGGRVSSAKYLQLQALPPPSSPTEGDQASPRNAS